MNREEYLAGFHHPKAREAAVFAYFWEDGRRIAELEEENTRLRVALEGSAAVRMSFEVIARELMRCDDEWRQRGSIGDDVFMRACAKAAVKMRDIILGMEEESE